MENKVLVFDLDGTLLNSRKEINESNIECITKLTEIGYQIIICTGRKYREAKEFIKKIQLSKNAFYICDDGAIIYNGLGNVVLKRKDFSLNEVQSILDLYHLKRCIIYTDEKNYYLSKSMIDMYKHMLWFKIKKFSNIQARCLKGKNDIIHIKKIVCYELNNITSTDKQFVIHKFDDKIAEILPYGCDKYFALKQLDLMGKIELGNVIYFGDDENDLECFENIENTVAMSNAKESIKSKAKYIIGTNESNAIAEFIKEYLEIY